MKIYKSFYIVIAFCLFILGSCSLLRPKCKIEKCHILKTHTHPHIFDKKKFKGEKKRLRQLKKKRKKKQPIVDSTDIITNDSLAQNQVIPDSTNTEALDHKHEDEQKLSKKEQRKLEKEKAAQQDDLGPEEDNEETVDEGPSWEDDLWNNGSLEEEDENTDQNTEEEVDNEELVDAEEEEGDSKKELKKELKAEEKTRKAEEKASAKQAKKAKKAENKVNREWRSNITPWWRWNQKPKIGEKWKRPKRSKINQPKK